VKKILLGSLILSFLISFTGCLTVETKEYHFKLKKGKSGEGSVKYINIMTDNKDSVGVAETDYRELIDSYLNGDKLKEEYPDIKNVRKRLYEEDNQLCAEMTFEFDDITRVKFYKYADKGPWCYHMSSSSLGFMGSNESYFSSNGTWGGETMPVIFWDGSEKVFDFKTTVTSPGTSTLSLLDIWKQDTKE
jgi:hypothetical protein